mmetsp:Transcript_8690/g.22489  ORF Transcript_8690/g.22489 Transcript_8690/m.22489 type:complete len:98 (+) Transcript_8690:12-305(+)
MGSISRHAGFAASLKSVTVSFSPTASSPKRVAAVRELLRQLRTPHAGADPKLETKTELRRQGEVSVVLSFAPGTKVDVPADQLNVRDMISLIEEGAT